jgi:beta-galactosidase
METLKNFPPATLALFIALLSGISPAADARIIENFDAGWNFLKAGAPGAEQIQFADSAWRKLDVPHDWSIEGPFAETNSTGPAGAYLPNGIGWYRKHFSLPEVFSDRLVFVEFDGVMANSDVWINGFHLGNRPYGCVSFSYDLTGHLNFGGKENVLAVRADNSVQPASRWYSGAGIYRHVRLVATDPVHVEHWGVFVSTPKVSREEATVNVQTAITNSSDTMRKITLQTIILAPGGKAVASIKTNGTLANGTSAEFRQEVIFPNPRLWNLDDPELYRAVTTVRSGGAILDEETNSFGIRDAHFDAATGFWLNGKNLKIKGVGVHFDGGAFGTAVPMGVWEHRLAELKKLGVNAIRTAHNPPAPEFLDLCDRMGFLVIDELFDCWTVGKPSLEGELLADYHLYFDAWSSTDAGDTVRRDRNHPSVILYSAGNEIHDTPHVELATNILARLVKVLHAGDPTRPVTQALFRPNVSHDYDDGLADLLDVIGQNYRENEILAAHAQNPARKIIGTENSHSRASWLALRDHAPYAGQFLWAGVDYLGESRRWPVISSGSGLLDRTGTPKPMAFERQSWWSDAPMVRIVRRTATADSNPANAGANAADRYLQTSFSDWTPTNLQPHTENVEVYSNCKEVELFLNSQSLGAQTINADASPRIWDVPFAPGILKAVARNNKRIVATDKLQTAGKPAKIVLSTETKKLSPAWDDVAIVRAKIVDAKGVQIPYANDLISFKVSGPGVIAAVDNADRASHESFQAGERRAFLGECVAFMKATAASGKIVLTAAAPGLDAGSITIKTSRELLK